MSVDSVGLLVTGVLFVTNVAVLIFLFRRSRPPKPAPPKPRRPRPVRIHNLLNATGNILIRTTSPPEQPLPAATLSQFTEVTAFCAAATRAITSTINPDSGKFYSIYNVKALERVLLKSGLFVKMTEEKIDHTYKDNFDDFGRSLYQKLFNDQISRRDAQTLSTIFHSAGQEVVKLSNTQQEDTYIGHIIFTCEYLSGVSAISAVAVYYDYNQNINDLPLVATDQQSNATKSLELIKATYLYTSPRYVNNLAAHLSELKDSSARLDSIIAWRKSVTSA
ncbi:MAG: hypothetical protein AAFX87_01660 [Bacteroidota bacterium]